MVQKLKAKGVKKTRENREKYVKNILSIECLTLYIKDRWINEAKGCFSNPLYLNKKKGWIDPTINPKM